MRENNFEFLLYRLNILDDEFMLGLMGEPIKGNKDIVNILKEASKSRYDYSTATRRASYKWSVRKFVTFDNEGISEDPIVGLTLARSTVTQDGTVVTEDDLVTGTSEFEPPLAVTINMIFYLQRHLVAVEDYSYVTGTDTWRPSFQNICNKAAAKLNLRSKVLLGPIPQKMEILKAFSSFSKLIRLKVDLLLPNPDLTRYTKKLYEDLRNGGIREYIIDMRNPQGLNQGEGALPHSVVSMAQSGYKKGEVTLDGIREGRREKVKTGLSPSRGKIDALRDYVRGISSNVRTEEAKKVVSSIIGEIERMVSSQEEHTP